MKTMVQLNAEIFEIIAGEDIRVMVRIIEKNFPKSRGEYTKLNRDQLEKLVPLLKEAYGTKTN